MGDLSGRRALVTGSTSGIGLAVARALAVAGADLIVNGFGDLAEIERIRAELARNGGDVRYDGADMTDPAAIETMMAAAGTVDILVNNAGIQHVAPVDEFPVAKWDAIIALNLSAAFHTTRLALPGMRDRGWGRIVNIASTHGLVASPGKSAYVAAKHGIVGFTKSVALEAAVHGVTVNAVAPGFVRTPLVESQIAAHAAETGVDPAAAAAAFLSEKHPTERFVEPAHVAALVRYLCSDEAASITGTAMPIDGGWTAR